MPDERQGYRRDDDREAAIWRGGISEKVHAQGRALDVYNERLNNIVNAITQLKSEFSVMHTELAEVRVDVNAVVGKIEQSRESTIAELKNTLEQGRLSRFQVALVVIGGIVASTSAALIVFALTGQVH